MSFRRLYGWFLVATVAFTLACFGASLFFATRAGAAGKFPGSLFEAFANSVSPMTEIREEERLDLQGLREFSIDVGSIDLEVSLLEEKVPQDRAVSPPSAPKGSSEVAVLSLSGKEITLGKEDHPQGQPLPRLIAAHRNGDVFEVSVRRRSGGGMRFEFSGSETKPLKLQLKVPTSFAGALRIQAGSGDIEIRKLANLKSLRVKGGSGSVLVEEGEIENAGIRVGSGEIDFRARALELRAESGSGDINLELGKPTQNATGGTLPNVEVSTSSGDVSIAMSEQASFHVDLKTRSGDISSEFSEIKVGEEAREVQGRLGSAQGHLSARTDSGDLTLRKQP